MFGSLLDTIVELLLLRVFTPATKSRKLLNGLNTLKPWFTTLQRHMRLQTTKKFSGQNARLIRSVLVPSRHPSLSPMLSRLSRRTTAKGKGKSPRKWASAGEQLGVLSGRTWVLSLIAQEAPVAHSSAEGEEEAEGVRQPWWTTSSTRSVGCWGSLLTRGFSFRTWNQTNRIAGGWVLPLKKCLLSCIRSILSTSWCLSS